MRIVGIGAGPAGLYAALLLKKADPTHDITVYERNAAGETFGWGVVFSDATLSRLREADLPTYTRITDAFVRWSAIDIHYRDRLLRSGGHVFAAISRIHLLRILQERCAELGVELHFETEIADPERVAGAELVLGGDGIHSGLRSAHADKFRPSLDERRAKYIWYGTELALDAFTFIFREHADGLFQAHAYPFDGTRSTFIVETDEATWRRAGLDQATEAESIAYCERLFADHLHGAKLLSNRSRWINFVTVRNRSWVAGKVVLLGDAAHTAHFSIGSGTKLAMEDAIALAEAVDQHRDLDDALAAYEKERRPVVDRFQEAAQDSLEYFEEVSRYTHLEPVQFAFYLLTRSGRITYDSLRLRDARFVADVDRWFAAAGAAGVGGQGGGGDGKWERIVAPPPALTPLTLRDLMLPNRVVLAPVSAATAEDGLLSEAHRQELRTWAASGAGLVLCPPMAVAATARVTPADPGLYADAHAQALAEAVEEIHAGSPARVGVRLGHGGRRGATRPRVEGLDIPLGRGGWPLLSASPIPYTRANACPKQMTRDDMDTVREAFVAAAGRARDAGVDLLQVDAADGYLLSSFISPLTNAREDQYGGELGARMRYPLEVVEAVRAVWPDERPLSVRITATDWAPGGTTVEEAVVFARALVSAGCDLVEVRAGQVVPHARPTYGRGFLVPFADQIRNEARVPTLAGGALTTLGDINTALAAGRADLCVLSV